MNTEIENSGSNYTSLRLLPEVQEMAWYASSKGWLKALGFPLGICTLDFRVKEKTLSLTFLRHELKFATNWNKPLRISHFYLSCIKHIRSCFKVEVHFSTFHAIFQNRREKSEGNWACKKRNPMKRLSLGVESFFFLVCKTNVWVSLRNRTSWTITKFHMSHLQVTSVWSSVFHRVRNAKVEGRKSRSAIAGGNLARKQVHQDRGC